MTKFIKVINSHGNTIYINPDYILHFGGREDSPYFEFDGEVFNVKTPLSEIVEQLVENGFLKGGKNGSK